MPAPTIPFDTFTLAAVASELRHAVLGARVQKIQQPTDAGLIVSVYGRGGAHRILLSADPRFFRIHLTQARRANPINAAAFCQACRKDLEGAIIDSIELPRFDRVLHILFCTHDGERARLVAELMGRNANLVLVSGAGIVRGAMRATPADSDRPLRPGRPYSDPPGYTDRADLLTVASPQAPVFSGAPRQIEAAAGWLAETFSGMGRFAAGEVLARAQGDSGALPVAVCALMDDVRSETFRPHSIAGEEDRTVGVWAFEPLTVPPGRRHPRDSISVALDTFYTTAAERGADEGERTALARILAREIQYRRKELAAAQTTIDDAGRADDYERLGNNLLANLARVERGAASITVSDLYTDDGGAVTITLDPKRSAQENAEGYFARARKARDAADHARERAVELSSQLHALEALNDPRVDQGDADLASLRQRLAEIVGAERAGPPAQQTSNAPPRKVEKPFGGHRIRTYTVDGFTLLVGETAEANDYLTTRVAAPSDLWMHVRSTAGAHGVLRSNGRPDRVPETVIRRAAAIVAARSGTAVKHAGLVAVDVTEKRHVRKPRGAKPGLVVIQRERVIDVSPNL